MSDNSTIIVPINVVALKISNNDTPDTLLKKPEFDFIKTGVTTPVALGANIMQPFSNPQPFSIIDDNTATSGKTGNAAGIRLHWAMPDEIGRASCRERVCMFV